MSHDFKVGDYFQSLVTIGTGFRKKGKIYQVVEIGKNGPMYIPEMNKSFTSITTVTNLDTIVKLPLNNTLNRKLYPNRTEYNGYLIPAKTAAKFIEENTTINTMSENE